MRNHRGQDGAVLILVIGVIAALAILAAALTALTVNVKHNTMRDRQQTRSFSAAEAALDDGLATLGRSWPLSAAGAPTFDEAGFTDRYVAAGSGDYADFAAQVWYFDDQDADDDDDNIINVDDYTYDANANDRMYVEAQARVGGRTTRVRALVQRETISFQIPRGVAFCTEGDLVTHGGSVVVAVDPGGEPPPGYEVKGYINGNYTNQGSSEYSPDVNVYVGTPNDSGNDVANVQYEQDVPSVDRVLNPRILDYLRKMADPDNLYTNATEVADHYIAPTIANPDPDDLTGLVYLESPGLARFQILGTFNSVEHPGILVVRGGSLELTGGGEYYGIIYVDGGTTDLGNVRIHGAVICAGGASSELGGSQTINYNDQVWIKLNEQITLAAKIVPNSWREVPPVDWAGG